MSGRRLGWLSVVIAVACYWRIGYGYGTGDHEEILPQLLRALDPGLFPTDTYLLAEDDAFSVRFVFLGLLRALCVVMPPPVAVFALTALSWLGVAWAGMRLALALGADRLAAVVAVLVTVATVHWTPGGNAIISRTLVPESLAWTPVLLAVADVARRRPYRGALWLGAAGWLQPLIGLQVGLLLGLVLLWRTADGNAVGALKRAVGFGAMFFAVVAPVLIPTLWTQAGTAPPDDGLSTFYVTAWLRQGHHYLLFSQDPVALGRFATVVAVGLIAGFDLRRLGWWQNTDAFVVRTLAVTASLVALYVVGTEGAESLTVAKMQFFRLTVLAKLLLAVWTARVGVGRARSLWQRRPPGWQQTADRWQRASPTAGWVFAALAVAVTASMVAADVGRPAAVWRPARHRATDVYRAERWIAQHAPRDAVFLVPPGTTSFRSHALRSVAINFKPTTFRDDAMHRWLARLRTVAPAPLPARADGRAGLRAWRESLDLAYHATADWRRLGATLGADYALLDLEQAPTPPAGAPVFRAGSWAVFEL